MVAGSTNEGMSQEIGQSRGTKVSAAKGREKFKSDVLNDTFFKERQIFLVQIAFFSSKSRLEYMIVYPSVFHLITLIPFEMVLFKSQFFSPTVLMKYMVHLRWTHSR